MNHHSRHLLFIGIVGHAMRGLALAAQQQGNTVTGLDETAEDGPGTQWLEEQGIKWTRTPDEALLEGIDLIIISGGTSADYPLLEKAQKKHIPIQSFAEFLGEVTAKERSLVVAGTHGKTTTSAAITWLLEAAGRHPDYLIGIQPFNFESSARLDHSDVVVLEGDEYKASSLDPQAKLKFYHPDVLVLTSVEHDHPDVYPDLQSVIDTFVSVVQKLPRSGRLVAWAGSETVAEVARAAACEVVTYGLTDEADYVARDTAYLPAGIEFDVEAPDGKVLGRMAIPLFGRHNVLNALAAVIVALGEGLTFDQLLEGAATFKGAYRRFNFLSKPEAPITVIDDYAHHPTEVMAMLEATKLHFPHQRLVVVYRPHTYSRTKALLKEYHAAFGQADYVFMTDIEGAREAAHEKTISGQDVVDGLSVPAVFESDRQQLADRVVDFAEPGDVILCMTVSGYDKIADELSERVQAKMENRHVDR